METRPAPETFTAIRIEISLDRQLVDQYDRRSHAELEHCERCSERDEEVPDDGDKEPPLTLSALLANLKPIVDVIFERLAERANPAPAPRAPRR